MLQIFVLVAIPLPALLIKYITPVTTIGTIHHLNQDSSPIYPIKNDSRLA